MKHPVRRRLMYLAFQGLQATAERLSLGAVRAVGRTLGVLAYAFLRQQRKLTQAHLRSVWGDSLDLKAVRRISRSVFINLGQNFMEWLLIPRLSLEDIRKMVNGEGIDHLREALAKQSGVIMVTPHFGNWELIPLYLRALGFEGAVLARRLRYPEYESFMVTMRGAKGVPTIARGAAKDIARLLRANQIIGLLPDQDMESLEGIFVDFFGRPAHTPVGPAILSLMTGAAIVPCFILRQDSGFKVVIERPIYSTRTGDRPEEIRRLTQAWSGIFESMIRQHPDQWVWMHRRWKTQPESSAAVVKQSPANRTARPPLDEPLRPASVLAALIVPLLLLMGTSGCQGRQEDRAPQSQTAQGSDASQEGAAVSQKMSEFALTGYGETGAKRWELNGEGASVEGDIVSIRRPDGIGYDSQRTAYLQAAVGHLRQADRHVRLEHEVTIHTSDGIWLNTEVLHWIPDRNLVATEEPVRIETDHFLLRGRGAEGFTQLKQAKILEEVELVMNPAEHERPEDKRHVRITCDGPLSMDYEKNIAVFERNVHVIDPNGELFSDRLTAFMSEATRTIRYAEATGNVRIIQGEHTANSDRAVYEPAIGKITLVGRPSLLLYPGEEGSPTASFGMPLVPTEESASDESGQLQTPGPAPASH